MSEELKDIWYSEKQRDVLTSSRSYYNEKVWNMFSKLEDGSIVAHTQIGSKPNFDDVVYLGKGRFYELRPLERV